MTSQQPGTRHQTGTSWVDPSVPSNLLKTELRIINNTIFTLTPPTDATWLEGKIKGSPVAITLDGADPDPINSPIATEEFVLDNLADINSFKGLAINPTQATSVEIRYYAET